jgi:SAM-dependent methyltransferase
MLYRLRRLKETLGHLEDLAALRHLLLEKIGPVERYCTLSTFQRFTGDYELWRVNRIRKVLHTLGADWEWKGKRVLELGCGFGDIGAFFADAGANVVSVEGRIENLSIAKLRFRNLPNLQFVQRDLEKSFVDLGRFDVIIHFGLLYHIENIDENVRMCAAMSDQVFLETEVLDSQDPNKVTVLQEDANNYDNGLAGRVSMISPFYIKRLFEEAGMTVEISSDKALNAGPHVYDWQHKNDGSWSKHRRRFFSAFRSGR